VINGGFVSTGKKLLRLSGAGANDNERGKDLKRILHIVHSLNIGGLERVVVDLAACSLAEGYETAVCCLAEKGDLAAQAEDRGIRVFEMKKRKGIDPVLPFRIGSLLKKSPFDVVHTHNESGLLYGATGALLSGAENIVHTEHGKEPDYHEHRIRKITESILLKKVNHIVTVSGRLRGFLAAAAGMEPGRFTVILNGIDPERYRVNRPRDDMKRRIGIPPGCFVVGHIARLVPLKNQKFLLDLFDELKKERQNLRLIIIGSGPLKEELEAYSRRIGISNDVHFLGSRMDIPEILAAMDLFVLTSLTEGISMTILEAMAAGVPVVASLAGGNPEIIRDMVTGILIPLDSKEAWIRQISYLMDHESERSRIARNAGESVARHFSIATVSEKYSRLYESTGGCGLSRDKRSARV
jgi:sugar transferase (PEP-CTERM/EpsH1 system associated)